MEKDELKFLVGGVIADEIKREREKRGWTLYKLAEKSGIPAGNLHRIENGLSCPRIDTVQRICRALKMEISFPLKI